MRRVLSILVVDDHAVVREGLKRILEEQDDCVVTAEAANVPEACAWLRKRSFDLVLLDLSLPHYAVRALKDGADGYLNKESAAESLIAAVRKVASGGKFLTPTLAERLALEIGTQDNASLHESLSHRELSVLKLIARGNSLKSIAEQFHISAKTVTTYRARIMEKTGLASNAALTRYMLENQLLD